ncbi:hypothetical protein [Methyloradius palustris]|uniref:MxaK protein n=1 Tax=Methyloradius palustris TaxID=2778876 RepID=A0A8D5GBL7_9PROT|nr:hypothetical protein [Methyloradius palustris]BCM24513.1 hypothetical protein ZMTM_07720 [Methyloradius palustris]
MAQHLSTFIRKHLFKASLIVTLVSVTAIVWSSIGLYQSLDYNKHLAKKSMSRQTNNYALLLNASLYNDHGQDNKSLSTYAQLAAKGDTKFAKIAYFNSGNNYLRQATEMLEKETLMGWDTAGPLLALAKTSYQHALNIDPTWSEAKYNFELALRLSPANHGRKGPHSYERDVDRPEERPSGWPSIPGTPRGMP